MNPFPWISIVFIFFYKSKMQNHTRDVDNVDSNESTPQIIEEPANKPAPGPLQRRRGNTNTQAVSTWEYTVDKCHSEVTEERLEEEVLPSQI